MEGSDQQRLGSRSLGARVQSTSCMFLWSAALYTSQYINYITLHCTTFQISGFYLEFCINFERQDFLKFYCHGGECFIVLEEQ